MSAAMPVTLPTPFNFRELLAELTGTMPDASVPNFDPPGLTPLSKPLSECTIGVFVSAGVFHSSQEPLGATNDLSYRLIDRAWPLDELSVGHPAAIRHFALQDIRVVYPLDHLQRLEREGVIGRLATQAVSMVGAINTYTEMMEQALPAIHAAFVEQGVDLVLLLPFCPACHTSVPLMARGLEKRGLPTIMTSCLWEAAAAVKAPRTAFLDFPMGCPAGKPNDPELQYSIVRGVLESAHGFVLPWSIREMPYTWNEDGTRTWLDDVREIYRADLAGLAERRAKLATRREVLAGNEKDFVIKCDC